MTWRAFAWLDRIDTRFLRRSAAADPVDRIAQAQAYTSEPVLAAAAFEPNLPMVGPGPWGLLVAIWRWRAKRKGEALAENFVLAVTENHLVALRTSYWSGKRVKGLIGTWDRKDLVVTPASFEGEGRGSWAMCVENRRLGRRFEAMPLLLTDDAAEVYRLLVDSST